jgi:hypothetical protein
MSEQPAAADSLDEIRARLLACAMSLRDADHIEPEAQRALADLVLELADALDPRAPTAQTAHLAETSAHLVEALHEPHNAGLIATARRRVEEAAARAEAGAPVATGVARQLIDLLAGLGI